MDNAKIIGQRINSSLAARNKLQKELASRLGVKDNVVSYFCSGTRTPNISQIIQISEYLDVSADYLLGLSKNPSSVPCAIDDLGLSPKSVAVIEELEMWDTPNEQNQYRTGAGRAIGILNCLLESPSFSHVMGSLMMCFDCLWVSAKGKDFEYEDYEAEEEIREAGHIVLHGEEAARFYANEAGNFLKELACKEIPILVDSCIQDK